MGALSYAIAVSITHHQEPFNEEMPHWFSFLHEQGKFSQIWLSGIRSSMVASFDSYVDRVGAFVQLRHRHRDQFSVDWLYEFGIPVWYPWGRHETQAALTDTHLARFAPLPHQLQDCSTFLTTNPTPQSQHQPAPQPEPQPITETQTHGAFDCKLFVSYFAPDLYSFLFRCCEFYCNTFLESLF
jgi:hypothetical protein